MTVRTSVHRLARARGLACLLLAAGLAGCGAHNPYPAGTYERAAAYREHGKHREAIDAYAAFLRQSPVDSLAVQAQFEKAMSYMAEKEYPLATVELQILRQEYPDSELVEQAVFEEARAYLLQVGRTERDITPAYDARIRFVSFLSTYPASSRAPEVIQYLVDISDLVVRKRLRQLSVYKRLGRQEAMAITLDRLIEEETTSSLRGGVMLRRARLARDMGDTAAARALCGRIAAEYPNTGEAARAAVLLEKLPSASGP
ncbi:tetratricopeptide repeat protein [bacterium]|nr:tetratricopeptide repeat protein [bacterium]